MESLRAFHERIGHRQVKSYIQSGNIIFSARGSVPTIARKTAEDFAAEFGFAAKLMLVESGQLQAILEGNPYAKHAAENHKIVHAGICAGEPNAERLAALLARTGGSERFHVGKGIVYLHAPDGYGRSKFAAGMEKACGVPMTVRNWRTMMALGEMAVGE
jgi:uncharacterized protein (DUF1697 family)